jgi:DNA primase
MELSPLEKFIEEDFGIKFNGASWARSITHDSLVIDREKQIFHWNSEDIHGDAFIYLVAVRKMNERDAKELLKHTPFSGSFIHEIKDGSETIVYPKLVDVFHENLKTADRTYFYNRTITDESIDRFQLGYDNGFYMIPVYQDGLFKQFQMRRDSPKLIKNYYKGVGPLLFNSDIMKITNKIFIVEGIMSAIVLNQNGIPAVSMNCGCESFMPEWVAKFVHQDQIYILFDNDKAGNHGAIHTAKILGLTKCRIYNFWDVDAVGYAVDDFFIDGNSKAELMHKAHFESKYAFELPEYAKSNNRVWKK